MPRKKFIPDSLNPYHVSARSHNKEWFDIPMEELWPIFEDYLFLAKYAFKLEIISFVLMSNHFHLIVRTPLANLDKAMNYFMRELSREIGRSAGRINQTFGGPYQWSLIKSYHYLLHAYKYVYRNPVKAGLVVRVEDYKYSTIHGALGQSHLLIPIVEDRALFENTNEHLFWLNTDYQSEEDHKAIKDALSKSEFKFGLNRNRDQHRFETSLN